MYFLDRDRVFEMQWQLDEVCNLEYFFKTVADGDVEADTVGLSFTPDRSSLRPFFVSDIAGARLTQPTNEDVTITWNYRSRNPNFIMFSCEPTSYLEFRAGPTVTFDFKVQVLKSGLQERLFPRPFTTESVIYTEADQITDFGSVQGTYLIRVACMGEMWNDPVTGSLLPLAYEGPYVEKLIIL